MPKPLILIGELNPDLSIALKHFLIDLSKLGYKNLYLKLPSPLTQTQILEAIATAVISTELLVRDIFYRTQYSGTKEELTKLPTDELIKLLTPHYSDPKAIMLKIQTLDATKELYSLVSLWVHSGGVLYGLDSIDGIDCVSQEGMIVLTKLTHLSDIFSGLQDKRFNFNSLALFPHPSTWGSKPVASELKNHAISLSEGTFKIVIDTKEQMQHFIAFVNQQLTLTTPEVAATFTPLAQIQRHVPLTAETTANLESRRGALKNGF